MVQRIFRVGLRTNNRIKKKDMFGKEHAKSHFKEIYIDKCVEKMMDIGRGKRIYYTISELYEYRREINVKQLFLQKKEQTNYSFLN